MKKYTQVKKHRRVTKRQAQSYFWKAKTDAKKIYWKRRSYDLAIKQAEKNNNLQLAERLRYHKSSVNKATIQQWKTQQAYQTPRTLEELSLFRALGFRGRFSNALIAEVGSTKYVISEGDFNYQEAAHEIVLGEEDLFNL